MDNTRFAVVGIGNIGSRHLAAIESLDGACIAGICDIDPTKRERYSQLYREIPCYDSLEGLLSHCDADVVNVCTPHYLHARHALQIIASGRHVLVEKPMALKTRDADEMIEAAEHAQLLLMVVKQNRYNLPVTLVREAIEQGRLGRILMAQCNVVWNRSNEYYLNSPWLGRKEFEGGALYTQVSHFIDLLILMCGAVEDAGGRIETKGHAIEIEDCGAAWLRFDTGTLGSLFWTTCAPGKNFEGSILLVAEHGIVKIGGQYLNRIEHWDVDGHPLPSGIEWVDQPNVYSKYQGSSSNHDKVFRDVVLRLKQQDFRVVSGQEGRRTVKAIELVYDRCQRVESRSCD